MRPVGAVLKNVKGCLVGKAGAEALSASRGHLRRGTGREPCQKAVTVRGSMWLFNGATRGPGVISRIGKEVARFMLVGG